MRAIWAAVLDMPRRVVNGLADPIRRRQLFWRIVEGYVGGLAVIGVLSAIADWEIDGAWSMIHAVGIYVYWQSWVVALVAPFAEFVVYEFLLEPLGVAGHYFERGPRDGETFRYW